LAEVGEVEGVRVLRWGEAAHLLDVLGEERGDVRAGEVVDGDRQVGGHVADCRTSQVRPRCGAGHGLGVVSKSVTGRQARRVEEVSVVDLVL
jgi:hypothetical protein